MNARQTSQSRVPARLAAMYMAVVGTVVVSAVARADDYTGLQTVQLTDRNSNLPGALPRVRR